MVFLLYILAVSTAAAHCRYFPLYLTIYPQKLQEEI